MCVAIKWLLCLPVSLSIGPTTDHHWCTHRLTVDKRDVLVWQSILKRWTSKRRVPPVWALAHSIIINNNSNNNNNWDGFIITRLWELFQNQLSRSTSEKQASKVHEASERLRWEGDRWIDSEPEIIAFVLFDMQSVLVELHDAYADQNVELLWSGANFTCIFPSIHPLKSCVCVCVFKLSPPLSIL